jgi:hypothetical protein
MVTAPDELGHVKGFDPWRLANAPVRSKKEVVAPLLLRIVAVQRAGALLNQFAPFKVMLTACLIRILSSLSRSTAHASSNSIKCPLLQGAQLVQDLTLPCEFRQN